MFKFDFGKVGKKYRYFRGDKVRDGICMIGVFKIVEKYNVNFGNVNDYVIIGSDFNNFRGLMVQVIKNYGWGFFFGVGKGRFIWFLYGNVMLNFLIYLQWGEVVIKGFVFIGVLVFSIMKGWDYSGGLFGNDFVIV